MRAFLKFKLQARKPKQVAERLHKKVPKSGEELVIIICGFFHKQIVMCSIMNIEILILA